MDDVHDLPMSHREIELEDEVERLEATNADLLARVKTLEKWCDLLAATIAEINAATIAAINKAEVSDD